MRLFRNTLITIVTICASYWIIIPLFTSFILVTKAHKVTDPIIFTEEFDPVGKEQIYPRYGKTLSLIGDVVGYTKSPLFPYFSIEDYKKVINYCDPDYRVVLLDQIWNVFFIEYLPSCYDESIKAEYYGPFKTENSLLDPRE